MGAAPSLPQATAEGPVLRSASPAASSSDPETPSAEAVASSYRPGVEARCEPLRERKLVRFHAPREESYDETGLVNALETLASNPALLLRSDSEKMRGLVKDMYRRIRDSKAVVDGDSGRRSGVRSTADCGGGGGGGGGGDDGGGGGGDDDDDDDDDDGADAGAGTGTREGSPSGTP